MSGTGTASPTPVPVPLGTEGLRGALRVPRPPRPGRAFPAKRSPRPGAAAGAAGSGAGSAPRGRGCAHLPAIARALLRAAAPSPFPRPPASELGDVQCKHGFPTCRPRRTQSGAGTPLQMLGRGPGRAPSAAAPGGTVTPPGGRRAGLGARPGATNTQFCFPCCHYTGRTKPRLSLLPLSCWDLCC